jgi:hypothetical protein
MGRGVLLFGGCVAATGFFLMLTGLEALALPIVFGGMAARIPERWMESV